MTNFLFGLGVRDKCQQYHILLVGDTRYIRHDYCPKSHQRPWMSGTRTDGQITYGVEEAATKNFLHGFWLFLYFASPHTRNPSTPRPAGLGLFFTHLVPFMKPSPFTFTLETWDTMIMPA